MKFIHILIISTLIINSCFGLTLTGVQLKEIMPLCPADKVSSYANGISVAFNGMGVNTCPRLCSLLATLQQETTDLIYMDEIGGGGAYEGNFDIGN